MKAVELLGSYVDKGKLEIGGDGPWTGFLSNERGCLDVERDAS